MLPDLNDPAYIAASKKESSRLLKIENDRLRYQRIKNDPEYIAKQKGLSKKRFAAIKADPEKHEAWKANQRRYREIRMSDWEHRKDINEKNLVAYHRRKNATRQIESN